ncbi:MAG: hypothetical protein ABW252_01140 [Polyangiales bacterium]
MVFWALAVIVPGGLVLMALWAGARAVKARWSARDARDALDAAPFAPPDLRPKALPAPAALSPERVAA